MAGASKQMTDLLKITASAYPVKDGWMPMLKFANEEYRYKYSSVSGGPYPTEDIAVSVAKSVATSLEMNVVEQLTRAAYGFKKMDDR